MTTFYTYRQAIKDFLRNDPTMQTLGVDPNGGNILIERKADMWTMFTEAVAVAKYPFMIMIGVVNGKRSDRRGSLRFDVTIQIDFVVPNEYTNGDEVNKTEDEPWEAMMKLLDRWKPTVNNKRCYEELVATDFRDFEWKADPEGGDYSGGSTYGAMVRQTDFATTIQLGMS